MIFFYSSTRKSDKLVNPLTVITKDERKAYTLAVLNFTKNKLKGRPKLITI